MTELLVGTVLAVVSLCYVLYPLYRADLKVAPRPASRTRSVEAPRVCEKCGVRPELDAQFCSNCGAALLV